jgi:regulator of sigma E protease
MDMILNALHSGFMTVVPFVVLLGVLIFIHELGHFLVARWCGVRVETFSLGFGKKIFTYKKGDTTYALSLIPLGGYVKMFGEQPGADIAEEDKKHSFTHKNIWQRIAVVLAGPLMNFFFAIFIFFIVALIGEDAKTPVLGDVPATSSAYTAGFRPGDKIVSINGKVITTWDDIQKSLSIDEKQDLALNFEVIRENTTEKSSVNYTAKAIPNPNPLSRFDFIGEVEGFTPYSTGTTVGVLDASPLHALGMRTGDTITAVNGTKVQYWRDLDKLFQAQNAKEQLVLTVSGTREGDQADKEMTVTLAPLASISTFSLATLGLESSELYIGGVVKDSPAEKAGVQKMDRMLTIGGVKIAKWEDVITNIKSYDGKTPVAVLVQRDGKPVDLQITPKMTSQMTAGGTEDKRYTIGIAPVVNMANPEFMIVKTSNPVEALVRGTSRTWDVSVMTVMSFVRLFQAKISPKNIGGVISIGQAASETFKIGISQFLQMMAVISVNLFILNLLPIPVLDGGHLVFYIVELVKGAPLSLKKMEIAQQVGLALLMSLMIFALFNDVTRLFGR